MYVNICSQKSRTCKQKLGRMDVCSWTVIYINKVNKDHLASIIRIDVQCLWSAVVLKLYLHHPASHDSGSVFEMSVPAHNHLFFGGNWKVSLHVNFMPKNLQEIINAFSKKTKKLNVFLTQIYLHLHPVKGLSVGSFSLYSEISFQKSDSSAHRGQNSSFDLQGPDASQRRSSSGESIWWQQRSRSDHITQCLSLLCCLRIGDRSERQPSLKCAFLDFDGHIESGLKKRQTSQILTVSLQL